MLKKMVFLGTGGTIAGTASQVGDNVGYTAGQVGVGQLLQAIPTLQQALQGHAFLSEQVAQIDSKDMGWAQWRVLVERIQHYLGQAEVRAVVITHGTDTLEETAFFLSRVLPQALLASKAVVLTCAMRPVSALVPDGPQNVLDAVAVARSNEARGVLVVCAGDVHCARDVQKVHPYRLNAFDSGDAGPLAHPIRPDRYIEINNFYTGTVYNKGAEVIRMLKRPEGATIRQICEATGWQAHTVRGTFAGAFKKKLGLTVTSDKAEGGVRVYRIADTAPTA